MKNLFPVIFGAMLVSSLALSAYATTCPYDSDYKFVLKKALTDYYSNPQDSKLSPSELSSLLNFYLSSETITNGDCDQGGIGELLNKADAAVPDSTLLNVVNIASSKCDACPDGAVCGEENDHGQTCTCKDVNNDGKSEYCYLKPIVPPKPHCIICPDGTLCGEQNYKDETCLCTDVNKDQEYEYCRLKPIHEPTTTTTTIPLNCLTYGQNKCDGQIRCCEGLRCAGDLKIAEQSTCCKQGECSIGGRCTTDCPVKCKTGDTKNYSCPDKTTVPWCKCTNDSWICINSPETQCKCTGEGQQTPTPDNVNCCQGLTARDCTAPNDNGTCYKTPCNGRQCTNCGNGQCGPGENKCNCPKDCEQCTPGTTKTYTCPDQTQVSWCTCTSDNLWSCINSPETQCKPNKNCKTDTECVDDATTCHVCVNKDWLRQTPDWSKTHACAGIGTSICKCVDNACMSMSVCGDGKCDATYENATNCPKDCKPPVTTTTTTSSTTRPSTTTTSTTRGTTTTTKPPGPGGKMLWFAPDQRAWPGSYAATLDYDKLFTDDGSWATARSYVNVFKFYGYSMTAGPNAFTDSQVKLMVSKLNSWDISIALELEPIRTNPYCTGAKNAPEALALMDRLAAYGGRTAYIDIDEAYYHGSRSAYGCNYPMSTSADETISFINLVHAKYPNVVIGDIEPYPYFSKASLEQWITTFRQRAGYELPFFHLDVDRNDRHWNINDVKALETFCRGRGIRFGVIYNDNVQPFARSDQGFYQRTMDWASVVKAGRVTPEDRILQSWNDRPDYNLPDSSGYSFTQLVRDFARKY